LPYARCLLATGREPRRLPVPPGLDGALHVLRDLRDAEALRARLVSGAHLAIVGGGFIGLEVAASERALGAAATVIEILPRLLGRCGPAPLAARHARRHALAGVEIILGRRIEQIAASAPGAAIRLEDGGRQRLESWQNAEEQGARGARNMPGASERCSSLRDSGRTSTGSRFRWRVIRSARGTRSNAWSATTACCSSTSLTMARSSA
jgi:NADPH-dependent 2,4-dienoyl-CoA reductase/sulfur reductase-like enzyme